MVLNVPLKQTVLKNTWQQMTSAYTVC